MKDMSLPPSSHRSQCGQACEFLGYINMQCTDKSPAERTVYKTLTSMLMHLLQYALCGASSCVIWLCKTSTLNQNKEKENLQEGVLTIKKSNLNFKMYFNMHKLHFISINYDGWNITSKTYNKICVNFRYQVINISNAIVCLYFLILTHAWRWSRLTEIWCQVIKTNKELLLNSCVNGVKTLHYCKKPKYC